MSEQVNADQRAELGDTFASAIARATDGTFQLLGVGGERHGHVEWVAHHWDPSSEGVGYRLNRYVVLQVRSDGHGELPTGASITLSVAAANSTHFEHQLIAQRRMSMAAIGRALAEWVPVAVRQVQELTPSDLVGNYASVKAMQRWKEGQSRLFELSTREPDVTVRHAIDRRISELAALIGADYERRSLLLVAILPGAFFFAADLARRIQVDFELDFIGVSTYAGATRSSGVVRISKDADIDVTGRNVVLVTEAANEITLSYLVRHLTERRVNSVEICALVSSNLTRRAPVVRYKGFEAGKADGDEVSNFLSQVGWS